ncbi:hypothetical protein BH09BAC1_BH09BAC1_18260 [soil metagenome]
MKSNLYLLALALLLPLASIAQTVTLTPDNAYEGETLNITAVTSSPLYSASPATYIDYSFYQTSGSWTSFYPLQNPVISGNKTVSANFFISGSSTGWYDLYLDAGNYFNFPSVFFVNANLQGPGNIGGTINQGTPKAGSGAPVEGLRLYLLNENGDTVAITRTNSNGSFSFLYLPYDTYYLLAQGADNSQPLSYVIEPSHFNLSGVSITYDGTLNRLVYIKEIDLFTENLLKLFPNVFNSEFSISYTLAKTSNVSITLYDLKGALITTLVDKANTPTGKHNHTFNAADANIHAAGVYIVKVSIGDGSASLKIIKQ